MHEVALAEEVLHIVGIEAERHGLSRVTEIGLSIGAWSCVVPEALAFALEAVLAGSVASGARLDLESVPGRLRCGECDNEYAPEDRYEPCPACGRFGPQVIAGNDMIVRRVAGA
ncbi:MAG: hydrogenase maturation nickel metallochaperone HypA [Gammaproteobacteria bacterium]|nr:hydrogenase maturation nickel metallochaperone HypA [Gammaproteobacteria bacterium]